MGNVERRKSFVSQFPLSKFILAFNRVIACYDPNCRKEGAIIIPLPFLSVVTNIQLILNLYSAPIGSSYNNWWKLTMHISIERLCCWDCLTKLRGVVKLRLLGAILFLWQLDSPSGHWSARKSHFPARDEPFRSANHPWDRLLQPSPPWAWPTQLQRDASWGCKTNHTRVKKAVSSVYVYTLSMFAPGASAGGAEHAQPREHESSQTLRKSKRVRGPGRMGG